MLVCLIGIGACGSSSEPSSVVEVPTLADGSVDGAADAPGNTHLDSSLDVSAVSDTSTESSDAPDSSVVDVSSSLEASDAPSTFEAAPPSDAPHISPPPSDAPVDTGQPDAHDAGCTPGCDVGCLTVHDNGVGGTFTDCTPLGTYNEAQANLAANSATNVPGDVIGALTCGAGPNTSAAVCKIGPTNCACWAYAATGTFVPNIGHATNNTVIANCLCPTTIDPAWN